MVTQSQQLLLYQCEDDALAEIHSLVVHQIDQSPWGADDDPELLISLERLLLLVLGHSPIETNTMNPDRGPGLHQRIVDLNCKFTGRGDDEDIYVVLFIF